jgi:hypothetical protein
MRKLLEIIDQTEWDRVVAPLERAWTLPPQAYTDERVFAAEVDRIFNRDWVCVGRVDQVAEPGDYLCVDLLAAWTRLRSPGTTCAWI